MKNYIKIVFIKLIILTMFSGVFAQEKSCQTMLESTDGLYVASSVGGVRQISQNFCAVIANQKCYDNGDYFDAKQSLFMTILCENVGAGDYYQSFEKSGDESILKKILFEQFNIFDYNGSFNNCSYQESLMNGCNLSNQLPKLFNEIINDYFNIKQSQLYGVNNLSDDFDSQEFANKFSSGYFVGLQICDPNTIYYNKTCKYLETYMKDARNLLSKTKIIDVQKLSEVEIDCINDFDKNILYCGLLGDSTTPNHSFLNLVYNEYMRYKLFISYYSYYLAGNPGYSQLTTGTPIDKLSWNMDKVYTAQEQLFTINQSISLAFRSLYEISLTFPLHIGFRMYQEDATMFMNELSKIYSPIRTLYDKLRNVQKAE